MAELRLPLRTVTQDGPVYLIAEMSANHGGSLARALELVHAAKECGAHCIKIQTYTADTLTMDCDKPQFRIKGGLWDGYSFHQLYQDAYTPWDWHGKIKEEAEKVGLDFFSTPFDSTAVDFLEELGVKFYKIASFELVDLPLLKHVGSTGKPVIMSTGMATLEEIEEAVGVIRAQGNDQISLLKCSSNYPALTADMNLITISAMKQHFPYIIGLSDHSMEVLSSIVAVSLGARIVEKHLCLSRKDNTPDAAFSLEPQEFSNMAKTLKEVQTAIGTTPYDYSERELSSRSSRRSLYVTRDIGKGAIFTPNNVRSIRPGGGLHPRYYPDILGKKAVCPIEAGTPLRMDMVE